MLVRVVVSSVHSRYFSKGRSHSALKKDRQEDNFVYNIFYIFFDKSNLFSMVPVIMRHISTFRKKKQQKVSDENVLLLTHCASVRCPLTCPK